jgi:hypothetical protein
MPGVAYVAIDGIAEPIRVRFARQGRSPGPLRRSPGGPNGPAQLDTDPEARPAHVLRFGVQLDAKGLIAPSENADRAVRYLTKYLAKNISATPCRPQPAPPESPW